MTSSNVILIRHAEVEAAWKSICYGALDVPLSPQGVSASQLYALQFEPTDIPTRVYHSGLRRTEILANFIAERFCEGQVTADQRLRERDYGQWQGLSWNDAYASDPEHFHNIVEQPDSYRPPGGETTSEMQRRIVDWYHEVVTISGPTRIVAVSHSGPIAALAGYLNGQPANQWQPWMLKNLESISFDHLDRRVVKDIASDPHEHT